MAGYEVTLPDFEQLMTYGPYRELVAPFLARAYAVRMEGEGEATRLIGADGVAVDPRALHATIQADLERQRSFYNIAMTLWH